MRQLQILILLFIFNYNVYSQIEVADNTLKVAGMTDEEFYFGFAEGDEVIFSFEEVKGKPLKEVEIIEMPNSSKFMDYKTSKIDNKTIIINNTGVYKFRFSNSALGGRICKFNIKRTPASEELKSFNTNVYWKTIYDTSYYTVQERYLISKDTVIHNITDQIAKVHSVGNANGNQTTSNFNLPKNTVSWAYYIGVDQAGQKAFEDASQQLIETAGPLIEKIPSYGPLASLALGGVSFIAKLQTGEDVDYYIVDNNNINLLKSSQPFKYLKMGKVINEASKMPSFPAGMYHIFLSNDNAITGIRVTIKITAITVTENWGTRPIEKMNIQSHKVAYLK